MREDFSSALPGFSCFCLSVFCFTTSLVLLMITECWPECQPSPLRHMDQGQHRLVSSCVSTEKEKTFSGSPQQFPSCLVGQNDAIFLKQSPAKRVGSPLYLRLIQIVLRPWGWSSFSHTELRGCRKGTERSLHGIRALSQGRNRKWLLEMMVAAPGVPLRGENRLPPLLGLASGSWLALLFGGEQRPLGVEAAVGGVWEHPCRVSSPPRVSPFRESKLGHLWWSPVLFWSGPRAC